MPIAENLARARSGSGLGQEDLANALGVSRAMISYWEAGSRVPNDRQLSAQRRLLRSPIAVIVGTEDPMPAPDIAALCELLGVTVYRAPLGDDLARTVSGAFFDHPAVGFAILVNLDMTPSRRRFTVAHELAHALFHSEARYIVSTSGKSPRERFADTFAGEFLMPTEGVRRVMEEQGFGPRIEDASEVIQVQRFFGVSYITALVRLRRAKFLTQARFDEFKLVRPVLLARSLGFEIGTAAASPCRPAQRALGAVLRQRHPQPRLSPSSTRSSFGTFSWSTRRRCCSSSWARGPPEGRTQRRTTHPGNSASRIGFPGDPRPLHRGAHPGRTPDQPRRL